MKKTLLLMLAPLIFLASCNSGSTINPITGDSSDSKENQTVALSLSNYTDFVTARVHTSVSGPASTDNIYIDAYFEGSDLVAFKDCSITCHYQLKDTTIESDSYTVKLSISGDGYIPSHVFLNRHDLVPVLVVTAVSGTVAYLI